jgi:hypothetical protein
MLRPEEREDGELEVIRLALEQLPDALQLPVGQAEGTVWRDTVQRLGDERRQEFPV